MVRLEKWVYCDTNIPIEVGDRVRFNYRLYATEGRIYHICENGVKVYVEPDSGFTIPSTWSKHPNNKRTFKTLIDLVTFIERRSDIDDRVRLDLSLLGL